MPNKCSEIGFRSPVRRPVFFQMSCKMSCIFLDYAGITVFVVKAAALKQQMSKFCPHIISIEAGYRIYTSQWPVINVKAVPRKKKKEKGRLRNQNMSHVTCLPRPPTLSQLHVWSYPRCSLLSTVVLPV